MEGNRVAMQNSIHICDNGGNSQYWSSCDRHGCQQKSTKAVFPGGPSAMGSGSDHTIDTTRPFKVSHTNVNSGSILTEVSVIVSQGSKSFSYNVCNKNSGYTFTCHLVITWLK